MNLLGYVKFKIKSENLSEIYALKLCVVYNNLANKINTFILKLKSNIENINNT